MNALLLAFALHAAPDTCATPTLTNFDTKDYAIDVDCPMPASGEGGTVDAESTRVLPYVFGCVLRVNGQSQRLKRFSECWIKKGVLRCQ